MPTVYDQVTAEADLDRRTADLDPHADYPGPDMPDACPVCQGTGTKLASYAGQPIPGQADICDACQGTGEAGRLIPMAQLADGTTMGFRISDPWAILPDAAKAVA